MKISKHSISVSNPGAQAYPSVLRVNLDPDAIAAASPAARGTPQMGTDGSGLPTLLIHMIQRRDGALERVEAAMAGLIPGFKRIFIVETTIQSSEKDTVSVGGQTLAYDRHREDPGFAVEVEFEGVGRVPAFHLSEGTRILLALLTLLHSPIRPRLLLLDDLDRGLHPTAQIELVDLLRRLVQETPDFQIVTTAHSPLIVSRCAKEEVVVMKRNSDGSAGIAAPEEAPALLSVSELLHSYFSLTETLGAADLLQDYAGFAGNPWRSGEDEQRLQATLQQLTALNVTPPFPPAARQSR